jgi:hypothetical protein
MSTEPKAGYCKPVFLSKSAQSLENMRVNIFQSAKECTRVRNNTKTQGIVKSGWFTVATKKRVPHLVFLRTSAVPPDSKRLALHSLSKKRKEEQKSARNFPHPPSFCMNVKRKALQKRQFVID